jgi:hypothetical protein
MEAAGCSETAISYEVTRRHGAKDNLYIYRLENLVSCYELYRCILNASFGCEVEEDRYKLLGIGFYPAPPSC